MQYEVEKRINRNLKDKLPPEAELIKRYKHVRDTYYLFPNPMLRIRHAELLFPTSENMGAVCMKRFDESKNIEEFETSVENVVCLEQIFNCIFGEPILVVEGYREMYRFQGSIINLDDIKGLGCWTEVELLTNSLEGIIKASKEVERIFKLLGACQNELTDETYPEMIYMKLNQKTCQL